LAKRVKRARWHLHELRFVDKANVGNRPFDIALLNIKGAE